MVRKGLLGIEGQALTLRPEGGEEQLCRYGSKEGSEPEAKASRTTPRQERAAYVCKAE